MDDWNGNGDSQSSARSLGCPFFLASRCSAYRTFRPTCGRRLHRRHRGAKIMKTHHKSDLFRRLMTIAGFVLLSMVVAAAAQESRREVVKHSPTPADDAKPNSDR